MHIHAYICINMHENTQLNAIKKFASFCNLEICENMTYLICNQYCQNMKIRKICLAFNCCSKHICTHLLIPSTWFAFYHNIYLHNIWGHRLLPNPHLRLKTSFWSLRNMKHVFAITLVGTSGISPLSRIGFILMMMMMMMMMMIIIITV